MAWKQGVRKLEGKYNRVAALCNIGEWPSIFLVTTEDFFKAFVVFESNGTCAFQKRLSPKYQILFLFLFYRFLRTLNLVVISE